MRTSLPFRIANVYASQSMAGNPIAVFTTEVDPDFMQKIARQLNCTGTVFVTRTGPAAYSARMFSPKFEAPYGGAGSLGAVWAMGEGRWVQTTSGAVVETEYADGIGWTGQPEPEIAPIEDHDLADAIGLRNIEGAFLGQAAGAWHLAVVTPDSPADFRPDPALLGRVAARHSRCTIGAFRRLGESEVHGRVFAPAQGLEEDPACAGGAGIVARIMQRHFGCADRVVIREGEEMGRPSRIDVVTTAQSVRVGGPIVLAAEGCLYLG